MWIEAHAKDKEALRDVYALADAEGCASIHHFSEPWYHDGWVVRILPASPETFCAITAALPDQYVIWDETKDEGLFGDDWPQVRAFFEAASRVALVSERGDWNHRKLIHCALNSWGYVRIWAHGKYWKALRRRQPCRYGCHRPEWSA